METSVIAWPRIIYHLTDGPKRSEKGVVPAYTYDICETADKFKEFETRGWSLSFNFKGADEEPANSAAEQIETNEVVKPMEAVIKKKRGRKRKVA